MSSGNNGKESLHGLLWDINSCKENVKAFRQEVQRLESEIAKEEARERIVQHQASELLLATGRPERYFHGPMDTMWKYIETSRSFVRLDHLVAYCTDITRPEEPAQETAEAESEDESRALETNHESA